MDIPSIITLFLVHIEELEAGTVGIEVGQMDGITVTEAYAVKHLAVVVEGGRTPDDLILTVTVDIGNRHIVVAVSIHRVSL